MKFTVLTLFPEMVRTVLGTSMLDRAAKVGTVEFDVQDLRQWGVGIHKSVDDSPYGGGAGMLLKVDVVDRALTVLLEREVRSKKQEAQTPRIILLTPQGKTFDQEMAESFVSDGRDLILIAGHYEGFDERIRSLVDDEISIGDFVLTGGELPALMVVDAVTRLIPGSLGSDDSALEESFSLTLGNQSKIPLNPPSMKGEIPLFVKEGLGEILLSSQRLLEYPHYTRPDRYTPTSRELGELTVPEILTSGHHAAIATWRQQQALERTKTRRPDLLANSERQIANGTDTRS